MLTDLIIQFSYPGVFLVLLATSRECTHSSM